MSENVLDQGKRDFGNSLFGFDYDVALPCHPLDLILFRFLVTMSPSQWGKAFISRIARVGPRTKRVVERASASMAVEAFTDTLALISDDNPVLGLII